MSESILFLPETEAPSYKKPVNVLYHPDYPSLRYEILYREREAGRTMVKTEWRGSKEQAIKRAQEIHG
jgi:hypothetical protein